MDDWVLEVRKLKKSYSGLLAVNDISFHAKKGEIFSILGPNGAGKTTTINMICGLLKSDGGDILLNGLSLYDDYEKLKEWIGLCPQDIVIWEQLTCQEQLTFVGMSYGISRKEVKKRGHQLLERLGLIDKKHKLAKSLSGGMKRRLNMALALIHDPQLVILDEPQAGLDPQSRVLVRDFIRELSNDKTIILTTHDMDEADRLSDRIAIMDGGKILVIDTPEKIKDSSGEGDMLEITCDFESEEKIKAFQSLVSPYVSRFDFMDNKILLSGHHTSVLMGHVNEAAADAGLSISELVIRKRSLEDAFIQLTGRRLRE